ncbi:MAG: Fis family transcriptional regulator [Deltaproteobacteria bacterium RIFOXYA12_FULL_58_15]|nr:MAG: Fis family transcriptional regulator [Deltaproteobacteria bacterium RIFOXYA12_FULL_58_15]OGR07374.1 MAG: Fis family transcriptional regulator [Deltaproteobacteria bacterium RIFOXYB12_FULL_58_9]
MAVLIYAHGDTEQRFPLFRNITRIGSDPTADISLGFDNVAADHAHVLREGDAFVLASLGRGRPLVINGKKEKRARLQEGDTIEIGEATLTFALHDDAVQCEHKQPAEDKAVIKAYRELVSFSEKLLHSKDLDGLLATLMDTLIEVTRSDKGFLILFEDGNPLVKVARNVQRENIDDAIKELSDSIISKVVREQQPVIVADAQGDAEFKASLSVINLKLQSVMCVPLTEAGELLGIIYLGSNKIVNLFDPAMLEAVTVFASQASLLIRNAMLLNTLRADNEALRQAVDSKHFGDIIGASEHMQEVFRKIRKVAPTGVSVLITGETGTGKELIAQEIHRRSDRADQPFVVVNCGAIPENLLESELFGHVRGAFTGAVVTREGRFQCAHKGTLFLDEIGEMPASLQVKLLRALQEKVVTKVGGTKPESVDIRVVAATNKNLDEEMKKGTFREDLYYRLNVVTIHLPPLRDRGEDLMLIGRYLLKRHGEEYNSKVKGFSPQCVMLMKKYDWPGNIRQLENRIKKAIIMADRVQLAPEDVELSDADLKPVVPLNQAKEDFQRRYINEVLARNNGNRTKTAQDLGVDPRTIFRHLEREDGEDGAQG